MSNREVVIDALERAYDQLPCTCGDDAICDCAVAQVGNAISILEREDDQDETPSL